MDNLERIEDKGEHLKKYLASKEKIETLLLDMFLWKELSEDEYWKFIKSNQKNYDEYLSNLNKEKANDSQTKLDL